MNRFLDQVDPFRNALLHPEVMKTDFDRTNHVECLIRGMKRKAGFAIHHLSVLRGVKWDDVRYVGRRESSDQRPKCMNIGLPDAELILSHPQAVIDHVYIAFDGLIASIVNITDTMGRVLNARYELGIPERQASLLSLKNRCAPDSPIGRIVRDIEHTIWLSSLRDLRGRCQHADIDDALLANQQPFSTCAEPFIQDTYDWRIPRSHASIVEYGKRAIHSAERTLVALSEAVQSNPNDPHL